MTEYGRTAAERAEPTFSTGAVARMFDLAPATIRTWEARDGLVVPRRSAGGQRLYARDQVDQLCFVRDETSVGRRPGEAYRLLRKRIARGGRRGHPAAPLLAEATPGAAAVCASCSAARRSRCSSRAIRRRRPGSTTSSPRGRGGRHRRRRLRLARVKALPVDLLERPLALLDRAEALLA